MFASLQKNMVFTEYRDLMDRGEEEQHGLRTATALRRGHRAGGSSSKVQKAWTKQNIA
jgi:hypothetical protein